MSKAAQIEQSDRWFRGEEKILTFDIVDADEEPIDVSGFAMSWVLQEQHDGEGDVLAVSSPTITVGDGVATDDRVSVPIESSATASLEPRVYRQSLWRTDTETPQLLASGSAMLQQAAELDA